MRALIDARVRRRGAGIEAYATELVAALGRVAAPGEVTALVHPRHALRTRRAGVRVALSMRGDVDVVHGPAWTAPEHPRAARVATIHDLGFVTHPELHPPGFGAELRARIEAAAPHTARWICDSDFTRGELLAHFAIDSTQATTIRLGVSSRFAPTGDRHPGRYLLHVGSLVPRKDIPTLLEAFSLIAEKHPDLEVILAGNRMRSWATDAPKVERWKGYHPELAPRVHVLGYARAGRLPPLYRGAAALVSTARLEGFALPVLEALASGTPVVASSGTAVEEYAGEVVALAPPGDARAFAAALERVLAAPPAPEPGLALAAAMTWDRTAAGTLAVYREAAAERPA